MLSVTEVVHFLLGNNIIMESSTPTLTSSSATTSALPKIRGGTQYYWLENQLGRFLSWWNTTTYAVQHPKKGRPSWGSDKRSAGIWDAYRECAHITTGEPAMVCKACHKIFCHPSVCSKGNSLLENHMNSTCTQRTGERHGKQLLLPNLVGKVNFIQSCIFAWLICYSSETR